MLRLIQADRQTDRQTDRHTHAPARVKAGGDVVQEEEAVALSALATAVLPLRCATTSAVSPFCVYPCIPVGICAHAHTVKLAYIIGDAGVGVAL